MSNAISGDIQDPDISNLDHSDFSISLDDADDDLFYSIPLHSFKNPVQSIIDESFSNSNDITDNACNLDGINDSDLLASHVSIKVADEILTPSRYLYRSLLLKYIHSRSKAIIKAIKEQSAIKKKDRLRISITQRKDKSKEGSFARNLLASFAKDDTPMCESTHLILKGHLSSDTNLLLNLKNAELKKLHLAYGLGNAKSKATKKQLVVVIADQVKKCSHVPNPGILKPVSDSTSTT